MNIQQVLKAGSAFHILKRNNIKKKLLPKGKDSIKIDKDEIKYENLERAYDLPELMSDYLKSQKLKK